MGRGLSKVPRPGCQQHPGSHAVLDGHYGPKQHRRPRYRCYYETDAAGLRRWHRFTEMLPRQMTDGGVCVFCERDVHGHEGPPTPRGYEFAARYIAAALVAVGRGESYRSASAAARAAAERFPHDKDGNRRFSNHGQVIADWVEVFAPVVFEQHRRTEWPTDGSLLLDHVGFRTRKTDKDGRPVVGPVAFNILAAAGYEGGRLRLWHVQSSPTVLTADWKRFLSGLDGAPPRVVTDGHGGTIKAATQLWPDAEFWRSEWHLKDALRDYLRAERLHGNSREMAALEVAFASRLQWDNFVAIAYRTGIPGLCGWIDQYGEMVEYQLAHRPREKDRHNNPLSIAGIDRSHLDQLKQWIEPRATGFLNRDRMDRLLMLMQLQLNGLADENAYARAIREWLIENDGRPAIERRSIADHDGPSLLSRPALQVRAEKEAAREAKRQKRR